jgi:PTH1 family peptidyl-tRNA hydrolase
MKLFVFLGNPGDNYLKTIHNAGFIAGDRLIELLKPNAVNGNWKGLLYKADDVLILKPQTFMNLSGQSVVLVKNFYKIDIQNIVVFYDDIDLEFAKIKIKLNRGNGGHNGIKSIDGSIGKDYFRVRIGVDRPSNENIDIADYVLMKFNNMQYQSILNIGDKIYQLFDYFKLDLLDLNNRSKLIEDLNK